MPQTDNDRIFGNLPRHRSLGNFSRLPAVQRQSRNWPRMGAAAKEFLVEQPDAHIPENLQDVTENPLRQTADKDRMARLLSGPLKTAIEKHPKENEACTSEGAKDVYKASTLPLPLPLPLPSSELLECISGSIAKEEACMLSPQEPSASLNESMSGSALLALGK
ncbi:hypothetical protein GGI12_000898 [Dipsacomyces acuminosporus]|nr:hypothetical protein GGI12_000898 [Dipsacomyces acuminosporus]